MGHKEPEQSLESSGGSMTDKARKLWALLDDIDTLDDACREDDAAFRKRCYAIQRKRFGIMSGDEYDTDKAGMLADIPAKIERSEG